MDGSLVHGQGLSITSSNPFENHACRTSNLLTTPLIGLRILVKVFRSVSTKKVLWGGISEADRSPCIYESSVTLVVSSHEEYGLTLFYLMCVYC